MPRSRIFPSLAILMLVALAFSVSADARGIEPVSPGGKEMVGAIDSSCPAFSWASDGKAEAIELVIYRVGALGIESQPVVQQMLPGRAASWTPSLGQCLARGGQYAWTVRSIGADASSEWSAPSFFKVSAAPSQVEFERAVDVVRRYLADQDQDQASSAGAEVATVADIGTSAPLSVPGQNATAPPAGAGMVVSDADIVVVDPGDDSYHYVQLDTVGTSANQITEPPAADCNEVNERGRMFYDPSASATGGYLWICDDTGWARQNFFRPLP